MRLTAELVARAARAIDDPGPMPGLVYYTEAGYDDAVQTMLAARPSAADVWLRMDR